MERHHFFYIYLNENNMERYKLMAKLEEIQLTNYNKFKGGNEADLQTREDIADLFAQCQQDNAETDNKIKLIHQLFIGKVADEIGQMKTIELLKESHNAFKNQTP